MNKHNPLIILLFVVVFLPESYSIVVSVTSANWYWTEYNWYIHRSTSIVDDSFAQTANPGAYFKIGFTGKQAVLHINQTGVPTTTYATVGWSIDDGPEQSTTLPVGGSGDKLVLASGLNPSTPHTAYFYVRNSLQSLDRWSGPTARITITGIELDDTGSSLPPVLHPKRMLAYWDSIGEGVNVYPGNGDLVANNAHVTWAFAVAEGLHAEISVVSWGRQGYAIQGNGQVPPLWSPDPSSNSSAWNWLDLHHPRTFIHCPDTILCGHGTNDWGENIPDSTVTTHALGWLTDQRKVCLDSFIFLFVPFGGFKRQSIQMAYNLYQNTHKDNKVVFVDLGADASSGLDKWGPSFVSKDGIHPWDWRDGQLGALMTAAVTPYLGV